MSLAELGIALSLAEAGSDRAHAIERDLRRRLVVERRGTARYPAALWFLAGGMVAIAAFQLGAATSVNAVPVASMHSPASVKTVVNY